MKHYGRTSRAARAQYNVSGYGICRDLECAGASSARMWLVRDALHALGQGSNVLLGQSLAALEASRANVL